MRLLAAALFLGMALAAPAEQHVFDSSFDEQATSFWYANMDHTGTYRGYAPDLDGDYNYAVYKTVQPGNGASIQAAINDDNGKTRHGQWLASQPRVSTAGKNDQFKANKLGRVHPAWYVRSQRNNSHEHRNHPHGRCNQREYLFVYISDSY